NTEALTVSGSPTGKATASNAPQSTPRGGSSILFPDRLSATPLKLWWWTKALCWENRKSLRLPKARNKEHAESHKRTTDAFRCRGQRAASRGGIHPRAAHSSAAVEPNPYRPFPQFLSP